MPQPNLQNRSLVITNLRRGRDIRQGIIYADLRDTETNELLIAATLDYIRDAINERM